MAKFDYFEYTKDICLATAFNLDEYISIEDRFDSVDDIYNYICSDREFLALVFRIRANYPISVKERLVGNEELLKQAYNEYSDFYGKFEDLTDEDKDKLLIEYCWFLIDDKEHQYDEILHLYSDLEEMYCDYFSSEDDEEWY